MDDESIRQTQAAVSEIIQRSVYDPTADAKAERSKASFDVRRLAEYVNEGAENITKSLSRGTQRRQRFAQELAQFPWAQKQQKYFLAREEEYVGGLRAATEIWKRMTRGELSTQDALVVRNMLDWPGGLELHIGMFIPTIEGQGTEEQKQALLPKCRSLEIIGTYAQTELGHGTFIRGLETTATYHVDTQQFIIHSPTQTATKWWPGGLGKTATHAVVMARLFVGGKDHGMHAFVVQLRCLQTHRCLEGITIGDIGPKFGYNGVDNGYLRFDHVLVPRDAMLAKYSKVTPQGEYMPPPKENQKATYATMLFVRSDIVANSARYLAKAGCIATRYCCVRRQSAPAPGEPEWQTIDYENTAMALLPTAAASFVLHATGRSLWAMYTTFLRLRDEGNFSTLPELHALSSGLKAVCTDVASDGIEACRRTCGGHGFSLLSGLPTLFASYVQNVTWEGDNNVMLLQTARFVLKGAAGLAQGTPKAQVPQSLHFLAERYPAKAVGHHGWLRCAFAKRVQYLAQAAAQEVMQHPAAGNKLVFSGPAWNSCTVSAISAARAFCHHLMLTTFEDSLERATGLQAAELTALQRAGDLWASDLVCRFMGDFVLAGALDQKQATEAQQLRRRLLRESRPDAISLVDAWAFTDYELNSAIGLESGDVYTALLEAAQHSPLNKSDEGPAWEPVLKPAMKELQQIRAKL